MIFQTERDALKILDQNETVRNLRPTQISSKAGQDAKKAIGLDKDDHEFRVGDQMREYLGEVSASVFSSTTLTFPRDDVVKYCTSTEASTSSCTARMWPRTAVFL